MFIFHLFQFQMQIWVEMAHYLFIVPATATPFVFSSHKTLRNVIMELTLRSVIMGLFVRLITIIDIIPHADHIYSSKFIFACKFIQESYSTPQNKINSIFLSNLSNNHTIQIFRGSVRWSAYNIRHVTTQMTLRYNMSIVCKISLLNSPHRQAFGKSFSSRSWGRKGRIMLVL